MLTQIRASAGSGKTYSLTRLFLNLLKGADTVPFASGCALSRPGCGYSLAEILAATFTNKAAAEMKSRIVGTLKQTALAERAARAGHFADPTASGQSAHASGPSSAEAWVERILRHYGALNIRTIDSLLATLVRLSALELDLPPDFQPSFDPAEYFTPLHDGLMDDLAAGDALLHAFTRPYILTATPAAGSVGRGVPADASGGAEAKGPAIRTDAEPIFLTADAAALRADLLQACRSLSFLSDVRGFTPGKRLHDLLHTLVARLLTDQDVPLMDAKALHARIHARHAALQGAAQSLVRLVAEENLNAAKPFLTFLDRCARSDPYAPPPGGAYPDKRDLDECLNKSSRGAGSEKAHKAFAAFMAAHASFDSALPLLKQALQLDPLTSLAHELHARLQKDLCRFGLLPAIRLPLLAGRVLSGEFGVSDALCRLGSRLTHLLLDEFQDTSREQWAAILPLAVECLAVGGSLTYVGDMKQAIYSWRGGDARLFDEALHEPELRAIAPEAVQKNLGFNWRSHPAIVRHNNAFFSLLQDESIARQTLEAMLPARTPPHYVAEAAERAVRMFGQVHQAIPPEREENEHREPESSRGVVRLYMVEGANLAAVESLVHDRMRRLFFEELLPAWSFGDIAVLVRSGGEASLAAAWITGWGLPVVTENSFLLADHPLINRLISFLTFLDYPLDDLAFWEFVSGPECFGPASGLSGEALTDWLAEVVRLQTHGRTGGRAEASPLYQMFRNAFPGPWQTWIAPFHSGAGLMSAYDTLMEIIRRYSLFTTQPGQAPFLRRLLEVAHLAEARGNSSLASFLAFWRTCRKDEKLPLPESMDAVRIMTIHKAKGLEFPVVVLPFHHRGKRHDPEFAVVELDGLALLTKAGKELPERYYPACITDELERLNLLYVAWTRPVHALHAFITRPRTSPSPLSKGLEALLSACREHRPEALRQIEYLQEDETEGAEQGLTEASVKSPAGGFADVPANGLTERSMEISTEISADSPAENSPKAPTYKRPPDSPAPFDKGPEAEAPDQPWHPMDWLPRLKIYRSSLDDARFTPARRGILAHLCLEHLTLAGPHTPAQRALDVDRAVRQAMRLFPLPVENPEAAAIAMRDCLFWFASLPQAPGWLAGGLREQGILDVQGNMHRVDLLVRGGESSLALEYKTGHADEETREEHLRQVRRYLRLLSETPSNRERPVCGMLVYLDEHRLEEVSL